MKGEKHTQMKYVNKLPSHKHNFSLMATLQSGPPGQREMSIFITRPPAQPSPAHPTPFWEGGRQATCPYLPCTLSLQPKKRGSVKRRQFPWNIRIKRTWKEGKGWKGKLITQKWIRNIAEKKQEGSSGGGRAGRWVFHLKMGHERKTVGPRLRESEAISLLACLKVIRYHYKDSRHISERLQAKKTLHSSSH